MNPALLSIKDLKVYFELRQGLPLPWREPDVVKAIDGVTFDILEGEVLALVGESGCGKTTIGKTLLRLIEPKAGIIQYRDQDLAHLKGVSLRAMRQKMQLIFQDPYESLDSRQSVFDILAEPLVIHQRVTQKKDLQACVFEALESTGLHPAAEIAQRYPHHLSGGQRQRVAIAAAMILEPEFIVADEPVSMLDVSVRAGILQLMLALRHQKNLTYLFITHDLSLAWVIADRIMVLYLGKVIEIGPSDRLIHAGTHPYTQALVSVIPSPIPDRSREQIILKGETPSPVHVPEGCRFHPRCWKFQRLGSPKECLTQEPDLRQVAEGHLAACHFLD
ncbi:MAG: ATP-binding cassette domain-containing protein [Chloroflexi bacterium]|nr:ATP-binding cassette domain-containing protein [Chloroflexota bacterium]